MWHSGLFLGEFGVGLIGVKCCSHTLLLHAWVSVRRARSHPGGRNLAVWPDFVSALQTLAVATSGDLEFAIYSA